MIPERDVPGPGQESVWDYPRPPRLEPSNAQIRIECFGLQVALTESSWRMLETSHPPVYYLPPDDVKTELLKASSKRTWCEWKGAARYFDLCSGELVIENAAWTYPAPEERYSQLKDYLAFYPSKVQACFVNDELVKAQPGDFYGGWITSQVVGPFKGDPGTRGW